MSEGKAISKTSFSGPIGTFNGFDLNALQVTKIDYIFVTKFDVESYIHIDERLNNGRHISDHLPVLISISEQQ